MNQEIIVRENEEIVYPLLWTGKETELSYEVQLVGRGAKVTFLALLLGKGKDTLKLTTNVHHASPDTKSEVLIKSALKDEANVDFDGLVKIAPGAKGTQAWLAAHILLLSQHARGRTVPSLEILENDIKAGHATTVGRISDREMFYIMSRGISEQKAKGLIMQGYLQSLVDRFPKKNMQNARKALLIY
jgi:Fe-S cluster assembly protein SufD